MSEPFKVETPHGLVELSGEGPWSAHQSGYSSWTIVDSNLRPARPTVHRRIGYGFGGATKADSNVVWAAPSTPRAIVEAANQAFAATTKAN